MIFSFFIKNIIYFINGVLVNDVFYCYTGLGWVLSIEVKVTVTLISHLEE